MPSSKNAHPPRTPTLRTVATTLKLSTSTVSRALQGDPAVTAKTRALVIETADRLGYRRDMRGVNLRTGRTFTLCAILASNPSQEFGDPAAMHLVEGLIAGVQGTDFKLVFRPVEGSDHRLAAVQEAVRSGRFDGIILDHTEPQDAAILYLLEHRVRFITFGRSELFTDFPYFDTDNEHAAYLATSHLAKQGHERIALIDPPGHYLFCAQRLRGYRRALADAGLPIAEDLELHFQIGARRVRERVTELMTFAKPPTGFVTINEVATLGVVSACRQLGKKVLERSGFVSRDGTNLFDYFDPAISSCFFPLLDAGEALATALVKAVEGAPFASLQRVEQVRFVERPHPNLGETL